MKYFILLLGITLVSCTPKKSVFETPRIGFNGFPLDTPVASIIAVVGVEPDENSEGKLRYSDVHFEGVLDSSVTYNLAAGKLKGGTFTSMHPPKADFDSLYARFTARYGSPKKGDKSSYTWTQLSKDDLFLSQTNGTLSVIASKLVPNR